MKKLLISIFATAAMTAAPITAAAAVNDSLRVDVDSVTMKRSGGLMQVAMNIGMDDIGVKSDQAVILTPVIDNGQQSVELPAVGVYGRSRYYHYLRANGEVMISGPDETVYKASSAPDSLAYAATVAYQPWMEGATLKLKQQDYTCCGDITAEKSMPLLADFCSVYSPNLIYVKPKGEIEKWFKLTGEAYVNFPVNRTEIYPDYLDNTVELGKIIATIDSVKNDKDITIRAIFMKGYASPEGTYANNTRLARGRTAAVKDYVSRMYRFDDGFITTAYEPENWEGLRKYVVQSALENKDGIISLIDSDMQPDPKEARIKAAYPDEYAMLLRVCYPRLRRTDYRIEYTVRKFSDPEEIKRIMATQPQKLSVNEFYIAAETMQPGSPEFDEAFATAVRMYPTDTIANLNAANSAMKRNDLPSAKAYLDKAGDLPQTTYARAVYEALSGNYAEALTLFEKAEKAGVAEAAAEAKKVRRVYSK